MKRRFFAFIVVLVTACTPAVGLQTGTNRSDAAELADQLPAADAIASVEKRAAAGDDRAMVQLGVYYAKGYGVVQDYTKAMDWFLRAFSKQNADAFVNLGVMHREGHGVPKNEKIAYCVFLTTHMCGLGSQSTQHLSNSHLRQLLAELPKDDIKDCLSNYTLRYLIAYLEARGKMKGIPDRYKPSEEYPALRDMGWFLDSELDAIYGEPTEEEKRSRAERDRKRRIAFEALQHTMVFQVRFPPGGANQYRRYEVITGTGMSSGPITEKSLQRQDRFVVFEAASLIYEDRHRYVTIENGRKEVFVFRIDHPARARPCKWGNWQQAAYVLKNGMDSFALLHGREPKSKTTDLPKNPPELRFKVVKE